MEHGTRGHGRALFDEELRIPLVVSFPERYGEPDVIGEQVRMIDLAPTMLDLAHISIPRKWEGVSLVGLIEGREPVEVAPTFVPPGVALTETSMRRGVLPVKSVRTAAWKIIVEPATALVEAYDLRSDPGEATNLWPERPGPDDELVRLLLRVPGTTVAGWRLAFSGDAKGTTFRANIEAAAGGRIIELEKSASRGRFITIMDESEGTLRVESTPGGVNLLMFDTEPDDAELEITISDDLGSISSAYLGKDGTVPVGEALSLSRSDALGLSETFSEHRQSHAPGAFIWWLPGGKAAGMGETLELSPDEQKRLKALGYIQ
jgi:hypothetical protein